jgi:hypothetical protein
VVAQQDELALHDQVHALPGVRAVADDVPQAVGLLDVLRLDVLKDRLQRLEVAVDIAYERLHARNLRGDGGAPEAGILPPSGFRASGFKTATGRPLRSVLPYRKKSQALLRRRRRFVGWGKPLGLQPPHREGPLKFFLCLTFFPKVAVHRKRPKGEAVGGRRG